MLSNKVKIMKLEEIEQKERDGVICISDPRVGCISVGTGGLFETPGEFCSECALGVRKEQLSRSNLDGLNALRLECKQSKLE